MTRLVDIERHIAGMTELLDIVTVMRSLAGVRMREAQNALVAVRGYTAAVAGAIADTMPLIDDTEPDTAADDGRQALVLFAAEHGFVGGFNERLVDAAIRGIRPGDALLVLGSRGAALVEERGRVAEWVHAMPTRIAGVPDAVNRLSTELYRRIASGAVGRVDVVFARHGQGEAASIARVALLPFDAASVAPSTRRQRPLSTLEPAALRERLISEHVFAVLAGAAVESIAAENAARFETMESARDSLGRTLDGLGRDARGARQAEITDELLDLVTGAAAVVRAG